nr:TauD/TfdA family dioxygenase [uncultured Chitinophaga sp.]
MIQEVSLFANKEQLPAMLELGKNAAVTSLEDFLRWYATHKQEVDSKIDKYGGLLLRGTHIASDADFARFVEIATAGGALDYVSGNSPRTKLGGGVYTSTEFAADREIPIHNEMSYAADWPGRIYFCSLIPAATGGETPLANSANIYQDLPAHIRDEFESKQVAYIRNLHAGHGVGASWQQTFETDSRDAVTALLERDGVDYEWKDDGSLRMTEVRQAIIEHPEKKCKLWFNQADEFHPSGSGVELYEAMLLLYDGDVSSFPTYAAFGDGSEIPLDYLETIRAVIRQNIVTFTWQQSDLLLLDNLMIGHGRMPYTGPRRTLVAMSK